MNVNYYSHSEAASISKFSASKSMIKFSDFFRFVFRILLVIIITATAVSCDKSQDKDPTRGVGVEEESISPAEFGNYHALIIGINNYKKWPNLKFAEKDADDIQKILISQYSFPQKNVTFLSNKDATREGILKALRLKLGGLGENDNLLIFYAGHGQLDALTGNGYLIPEDAGLYEAYTWISSSTLQDLLTGPGVLAKSVLVVADACFAGGLLKRSGPTPGKMFEPSSLSRGQKAEEDEKYKRYQQRLMKMANKKSRQVIASGGFEEVPDKSDFAAVLKHALTKNQYPYIDMEYLFFKEIFPEVKMIGQQDPALSRLKTGPELDGQFVLVKKSASRAVAPVDDIADAELAPEIETKPDVTITEPVAQPQKVTLTVRSNVTGDTVYINDKNMGSTRLIKEFEPGTYTVRVEKKGYKSYEKKIELALGDKLVVKANLQPDHAPLPVVEFYEIKPDHIMPGETSTLTWRTSKATSVKINGVGDVALSGSLSVNPAKTQTYKITAKNKDDMQVVTEASINVRSAAAPVIDDFSAKPDSIDKGRTTVLSWQTSNAEQIELKGIGTVQGLGVKRVKPSNTTSYTLIAKNKQGQIAEKSITVNVKSPIPKIGLFRAERNTINKGAITVLHWKTLNADKVELQPLGSVPLYGSKKIRPTTTTSYTLVASNNNGKQISKTIKINVHDVVVSPVLPVIRTIAKPILVTRGIKSSYVINGKHRVKYSLKIKNWNTYPAELFKAAPNLRPCGKNKNASRTWVEISDAKSKKRLYGYCALTSPNGLEHLSFSIAKGVRPPAAVRVELLDRKTGKSYLSNAVRPR